MINFKIDPDFFDESTQGEQRKILNYLEEQGLEEEKQMIIFIWIFQHFTYENTILEIEPIFFEMIGIKEKDFDKQDTILKNIENLGLIEGYKLSRKALIIPNECMQNLDYIQELHEYNFLRFQR